MNEFTPGQVQANLMSVVTKRLFLCLLVLLVLHAASAERSNASPADTLRRKHFVLTELEGNGWIPENNQKLQGIIVCIHGFGLNANSYETFAQSMIKEGIAVFAIDARGFGHWKTRNKHPKLDLELTVSDTRVLLKRLRKEFPGVPIFLLGESMGGAVALTTTAKHPATVDGVIASVPAAERFDKKKSILTVGTRLLFAPEKEFDVSGKVVGKAVSNEQLRRLWLTDSQNRLHISAKELLQFQSFMANATRLSANIDKTPVLIVQGCRDSLVKPKATVRLYNSIPCKDKKLLMVGEAEHLIFQKGGFSKLTFDMVLAWLRNHAGTR